MVELAIKTIENSAAGQLQLAESVFEKEFNEPLVHQIVVAQHAGARQGTHKQKTRSEVRGGGKKPWRQKGYGRARAGTIRSPIWVGGGRAFAAKPRDYSQKVNKKMYRAALKSILSELVRQERLIVVDSLELASAKTKELAAKLSALAVGRKTLIVTDNVNVNLYLASRNIPAVHVLDTEGLTPADLVNAESVLISVDAVKKLEEALA